MNPAPSYKKLKPNINERINESKAMLDKYPDRIPVICEKSEASPVPNIDKNKYLLPSDLSMSQFVYVIRKRIKLEPHQALFMFVNNRFIPTSSNMHDIYYKYKDEDGFLYITYAGENTYGA